MTIKRRSFLSLFASAMAAFFSPRAFGQNQCTPPLVTALYPSVGSGNSYVAIVGSGFTGATAVNVGTGSAAVQSFTVVSDTQINAYMSFHSAGTRAVTVTTSQGTSSGSVTFTHGPAEIATITPNPDLPNPYVFGVNGGGAAVTTAAQWALKQFELRESWASYWIGHIPPPPSSVILLGVVDDSTITTTIASNNTMRHLQVNLQTSGPNGSIQFGFNMFIPLHSGTGLFPVLMSDNWAWSPLAATPSSSYSASLGLNSINTLVNNGYILCEYSADQWSLDNGDTSPPEGIFTLNTASDGQLGGNWAAQTQPMGPGSTGSGVAPVNPISNQSYAAFGQDRNSGPTVALPSFITTGLNAPPSGVGNVTATEVGVQAYWTWGLLRCVDYLFMCSASGSEGFNVPVNTAKIAVTSISHDGGPPLYAAAYDTRIAACLVSQGLGIYSGSRLCEYEGNMGGSGPPPPTINDPNDGSGENAVPATPRSLCRYIGSAVTPTGSLTTVFQNFECITSDTHTLMAMIAPRGFMAVSNYIGSGGIDSPRACAQKFLAGRTAYAALGVPTVPYCWCSDNNAISGVTNGHILTTPQYTAMIAYLNYFFNGTALPANVTGPAGSQSYWCNTAADFANNVPNAPVYGNGLPVPYTWTPPSSLTGGGGGGGGGGGSPISAPVALIPVGAGDLPSGQGPWGASSGGTPAISTSVNSAAANTTLVIVPMVTGGTPGQTVSTLNDSAGNSYTVRNATVSATLFTQAIAYAVITHAINPGTTFTAITTGGALWSLEGAWAISGAVGGLDQVQSSFSTSTVETATLSLTTTQPNEIVIGFNYTHGSGNNTNIYNPETNGFASLWNDDIVDIDYNIVSAAGPVTWTVSWAPAYTYTSLLMSFFS